MPHETSPESLEALLQGKSQFALLDVREPGEYNSSHIPGASLVPRKQLEFRIADSVPFKGTPVVLCDDDGRRADLAASTVQHMGYEHVSVLQGGINKWVTQGYGTEWGVNVPSKDFGERIEVEHHVPEIDSVDLNERIQRGDKLVILDTRTPEEFNRFCIPGGRSVPGAELALRITDITKDLDDDTTVIINCAGRTRSIIGTRVLQRMGVANVYGLENGTAGWLLAGYRLETGADRLELPEVSTEGLSAAEAYASELASQDGVRYLDVADLQALMERRSGESLYLIDVRTEDEYEQGHIPDFQWFPGGQAVQRSDELAVVKHAPIVFACDGKVRATVTASWYRQMGFDEIYVLDGGVPAWADSGLDLETGLQTAAPQVLEDARRRVRMVSPQDVQSNQDATVVYVDTSQSFANGHVPGAHWLPRGWLEHRVAEIAQSKGAPVVATCSVGLDSVLAAATLMDMGYTDVAALDGGVAAWRNADLPLEKGLTGVMSAPTDMLLSGIDRNYADMMNYLRWEEELGVKYQTS